MTAITSITIADGKGSPINHVYNPVASSPNANYRTADAALPFVGQERISFSESRNPRAGVTVRELVMELPVLETATAANSSGYTAAPKVAHTVKAKLQVFVHDRALPAQLTDLRVLLKNLLTNAQVVDFVDNSSKPY